MHLLADESAPFLGDDLIVYLVLAMGAALVAGNVAALLLPPARPAKGEDTLVQAPVGGARVAVGQQDRGFESRMMEPAAP